MYIKHHRFELIFPAVGTHLLAVIVGLVVAGITHSISRGISVFSLIFAMIVIKWYGIPPLQVARRFQRLLLLYSLLAAIFCVFFIEASSSWWAGLFFALGSFVSAVACLVEEAFQNFKQLPELQQIGDSMKQKLDIAPLVSHITDIHITTTDDVARLEGGPGGHKHWKQWLTTVATLKHTYLAVSGDITDTGDRTEWQRFEKSLVRNIPKTFPVILAPGNHDLSSEYGQPEDNKLRLYFEFQAQLCPNLVTSEKIKLADVMIKAEEEISPNINGRAEQDRERFISPLFPIEDAPGMSSVVAQKLRITSLNQRIKIAETVNWEVKAHNDLLDEWFKQKWYDLFPLRLEDSELGIVVLVLNSIIPCGATLGDSALGTLGKSQMSRIAKSLDLLPSNTRNVLVITHHAPFRHPGEWQLLSTNWFLKHGAWEKTKNQIMEFALLTQEPHEAREFLDILSNAADKYQSMNFILFCGHRHTSAAGRAGRVIVLEGSSLVEEKPTAWLVFVNHDRVSIYPEAIHT